MLDVRSLEYLHLELFGVGKLYDMDSFYIFVRDLCKPKTQKRAQCQSSRNFVFGVRCSVRCSVFSVRVWHALEIMNWNNAQMDTINFDLTQSDRYSATENTILYNSASDIFVYVPKPRAFSFS